MRFTYSYMFYVIILYCRIHVFVCDAVLYVVYVVVIVVSKVVSKE